MSNAILSVLTDDEASPSQLSKFEAVASSLGADINMGNIAKSYGMEVQPIVQQVLGANWKDSTIKLALCALTAALFTSVEQYVSVTLALLNNVPEKELDGILESLLNMKSFK